MDIKVSVKKAVFYNGHINRKRAKYEPREATVWEVRPQKLKKHIKERQSPKEPFK